MDVDVVTDRTSGRVYRATDTTTGCDYALKLETSDFLTNQLEDEAEFYNVLHFNNRVRGFPKVHWFGSQGSFNILVMDLLGPSLERLFSACGRRFSPTTVLLIGCQVVRPDYFFMRVQLGINSKKDRQAEDLTRQRLHSQRPEA